MEVEACLKREAAARVRRLWPLPEWDVLCAVQHSGVRCPQLGAHDRVWTVRAERSADLQDDEFPPVRHDRWQHYSPMVVGLTAILRAAN